MFRLFNSDRSNTLSPVRQESLAKGLIALAGVYSILEASGLLNMPERLAFASIATCMAGIMLGGDGEYDPEQQPKLRS